MTLSSLPRRLALWAALAALAALALAGAVSASPAVHAAHSCTPPRYPGSGYFTSLKVRSTSCRTGRIVAVAYYHCRLRHGRSGTCHSRVRGFTCHERRTSIPTEIDGKVSCHRGHRVVIHTYQQNR